MEKFKIGDFALVEFIHRPRRGKKNWFDYHVTVVDKDSAYLLLVDNYGNEFLVRRSDVKSYTLIKRHEQD